MYEDWKKSVFKSENWDVIEDVIGRLNEGAKVLVTMKRIWKFRSLSFNVKRMMNERMCYMELRHGV